MSYPAKMRKIIIEYRQKGHTYKDTSEKYNISTITIKRWEKQLEKEGDLEIKVRKRNPKKINLDELQKYIEENPDRYNYEIAEVFNCSTSAVFKAKKKLKITRKKVH